MKRIRPFLTTSAIAILATSAAAGPSAMTAEEARHLISRTGFGASPQEIKALTGLSYEAGVAVILGGISDTPSIPMPGWVNAADYPFDYMWTLGQTAEELFFANRWMEIEELSGWWFAEMVATPSPITERLTLFWHDHFATSFESVENPQWMGRQNQFFRANAAGNFADLAHGILQDPAMLVYLSNTENSAESPNENLGREFLELFTLGEGRGYTQDDVVAASRMLTGHGIGELSAPVYTFYPEYHDDGQKTLFGQTGNYDASDLADMALAHPSFGSYIVEKLWLTFVSDQPDPAEVARLTALWKDNNLEIAPLLEALLTTDAFWAQENRGRLVKSPVELIAGTLRSLGAPVENATGLAWLSYDMGQALFFPPNVGGWPQGVEWINDASTTARATTLSYFAYGDMEADLSSDMMMAAESATEVPVDLGLDDLRVGQVFAISIEGDDDGLGGLFVLYDVSFGGQTWRAIPVWVEANTTEDYAGYGFLPTDCAPDCFASLEPEEGEPWIWYGPWEGVLDDDLSSASAGDLRLMQAIAAHLPALIQTTDEHRAWDPDPEWTDGDQRTPNLREMVKMARALAKESAVAIGETQGQLITQLSHPAVLGLQGFSEVRNMDDLDAYIEEAEQDRIRPAIPAVVYADARAWINDLPAGTLESKRAAQALLAVPRRTQGLRDEMVATDPDALVRNLILSPEFQVN